jgi:hypothetical protein
MSAPRLRTSISATVRRTRFCNCLAEDNNSERKNYEIEYSKQLTVNVTLPIIRKIAHFGEECNYRHS